ncbi:MAG: LysM peptidoglycan-binding domain-containing protein [Leptolyngbya sp. SIOISBB]|nr:LysM peptidoglycan-binding domain-containing protein [Leptolyngbya sp. SIOISBB]
MLFDQGKLEKLTFLELVTPGNADEPPQVNEDVSYVVQVNPDHQTLNTLLRYTRHQGQGASGAEATYSHTEPRTLEFDLLLDGTGVVPPPTELSGIPLVGAIDSLVSGGDDFSVESEINKLNQFLYEYVGEIHRPRKLLLLWGTLSFPCVVTSVNYRFTLFKPDGTPLRAIAACSFTESITDCERQRQENASSPDLTHLREVKTGDTLPLMSYRIYGKTDLYLEVARVNKLVNFRSLRSSTQLTFPPVSKEAKS